MDFLDTSGNGFFGVFKVEGRTPLGTSSDFNGTIFSVFLLEFQDYLDGVGLHLGLAKGNLRNLFNSLVGIKFLLGTGFAIIFDLFGYRPWRLCFVCFEIKNNHILFLLEVKASFFSISVHGSAFIYYMESPYNHLHV